ncbi:MAG: hypothetical protein R3E39_16455 [Anaerolineae bacterium]
MTTFYLNPSNAAKNAKQLRIGLKYFVKKSTHEIVFAGIAAIGFLGGFAAFGAVAIQMANFEYNFSHYGRETTATIVDCKMVWGRGNRLPLITYRYTVNNETYSNTWLAQFVYPDCGSVPKPSTLDIIYLENEPASSIEGTLSKFNSGGYAVLIFGVGILGFGAAVLSLIRRGIPYLPHIWHWWNQASHLVVLPGEIASVKPMNERKQGVQMSYRYQYPLENQPVEKIIYYHQNRTQNKLPEVGMRVVVMYFDKQTVTIA